MNVIIIGGFMSKIKYLIYKIRCFMSKIKSLVKRFIDSNESWNDSLMILIGAFVVWGCYIAMCGGCIEIYKEFEKLIP